MKERAGAPLLRERRISFRDVRHHHPAGDRPAPSELLFPGDGLFAFHLLLAYLVDHISIHVAFLISSVVSVFLVVSYLRLVVGMRFAAREAAIAQVLYLVLFSYAFFFEGFTGLSVTIGSIVTLFVVMQMTGRIRWEEKFAARTAEATRKPAVS